ncbi:hypothetical protein [Microbulbifer sp. PAAF003]|uniref:hypothetical protein n=1 Tax=Microbulbifer sp. PAAF003 TaxID=3243375 RepID=UPI0040391B86
MDIMIRRLSGVAFTYIYAFITWLGAVAGTCTMGDDGGFLASLIVAISLFLLVAGLLWPSRKVNSGKLLLVFHP